jgi:hypothetical protein
MPGPWQDDMQAVSAAIQQQGPQGAQIAQGPPMPPPRPQQMPPGVQVPPQGAVPPGRAGPMPGAPPPFVQKVESMIKQYKATGDNRIYEAVRQTLARATPEEQAMMRAWDEQQSRAARPIPAPR